MSNRSDPGGASTIPPPESKSALRTSGGDQREISLAIEGMTCGSCAARIEKKLNRLEGVSAEVNLATEQARVVIRGDLAAGRVVEEIEASGYGATVLPDRSPALQQRAQLDARVRSLGMRLVVSVVLLVPLLELSAPLSLQPSLRFPGWQWVMLCLAGPVVTWAAWPFYEAAARGARHGVATMDTLVSVGVIAATAWSIYGMFVSDRSNAGMSLSGMLAHQVGGSIYLDVAAAVITFQLAGRYYEARAKRRTGNALWSLASIAARDVSLLDENGTEHRQSVSTLRVGDRFVVRSGETVATDGEVLDGESTIDRSLVTGESVPVEVGPGDPVTGGTVAVGGRLVVAATRIGRDTQLAQMVRLVETAQNEKAAIQRLADRLAAVFVPTVMALSLLTLAGWLAAGRTTVFAFGAALSVLIIACPCALGLATPTALLVSSGRGAQQGIFFKRYEALELSRRVDTVVLDKTGTVTEGMMAVTGLTATEGFSSDDVLRLAGAVEQASEHLIARAVTAEAQRRLAALPAVDRFASHPGIGATGIVDGHTVVVGRRSLVSGLPEPAPQELERRCEEWEAAGHTVVAVVSDGAAVGAIALADTVKPSAATAVEELRALGLHVVLLTGDNMRTARTVGSAIGVDHIVAGVVPEEKVAFIRELQGEGHAVAMVGDGVNDGAALATADLGLALGSGTDVAINAADLIVFRDDLRAVPAALLLARRTLKTIHGNLAWAFAYNLAAIPLAASGHLDPLVAGATMALSSAFVVWNSARLARGAPFPADGDGTRAVAPHAQTPSSRVEPNPPTLPAGWTFERE